MEVAPCILPPLMSAQMQRVRSTSVIQQHRMIGKAASLTTHQGVIWSTARSSLMVMEATVAIVQRMIDVCALLTGLRAPAPARTIAARRICMAACRTWGATVAVVDTRMGAPAPARTMAVCPSPAGVTTLVLMRATVFVKTVVQAML